MANLDLVERLRQNVARVRETIAEACARRGRDPRSVGLVAVTKYVDPPVIQALLAAGVSDIGENRVQQLVGRAGQLGARLDEGLDLPPASADVSAVEDMAAKTRPCHPVAPRWHMIGHLQRNKVKILLPHARIIHSLDSPRLAAEISNVAQRLGVCVDAFLEINVAGEASKSGVRAEELMGLVETVRQHPLIRLRGLMTMAPFDPDPEHARPCFARLRELLEKLRETGAANPECIHLSMGMSQDYGVAVEEGATFVRVGSALYEDLPPSLADRHDTQR